MSHEENRLPASVEGAGTGPDTRDHEKVFHVLAVPYRAPPLRVLIPVLVIVFIPFFYALFKKLRR